MAVQVRRVHPHVAEPGWERDGSDGPAVADAANGAHATRADTRVDLLAQVGDVHVDDVVVAVPGAPDALEEELDGPPDAYLVLDTDAICRGEVGVGVIPSIPRP